MFFSSHLFPAVVLRSVLAPIPRGIRRGGGGSGAWSRRVLRSGLRTSQQQFYNLDSLLLQLHWLAKACIGLQRPSPSMRLCQLEFVCAGPQMPRELVRKDAAVII